MKENLKELLLKDLCGRLPYGLKVQFYLPNYQTNSFDEKIGEVFEIGDIFTHVHCDGIDYLPNTSRVKPYLRPMLSMTREERQYLLKYGSVGMDENDKVFDVYPFGMEMNIAVVDFLNAHHFDYRGLIEKGLALEASEEMYNN